jgi:divalent metal cation (Fe/Co/Zn/Cd) transporter
LLGGEHFVHATTYAIAVPIATMAIETLRATVLHRVARAWSSPALAAAAQNRVADIISSLAVLVGLVGVRLGYQRADAVAALVVAVVIARAAVMLAWRSGDVLMDRAPRGVEEDVERVIANVPGVDEVRSVRVRRSGSRLLGDARVSARRLLSVEGAEALSETIEEVVRTRHPQLDLTLVVEPQPRAEQMVERVHAVAERLEAIKDLHNVNVELEADGSLHLSMHAKLPGSITLDEATRASGELERRLRQEFPGVGRIDIHLEPLEPDLVRGQDVTAQRGDLARKVQRMVEGNPSVRRVRDVELSARGPRLIAHVVAEMEGGTSLEQAHRIQTELEDRLRQGIPELYEVVARVVP